MRNALGSVDTVLLLGGRSEIGLAIVERLVRDGARRVVLAARGAAGGEPPVIGDAEVHLLDFDASRPETHGEVIEAAAKLVGDLDVVIPAFGVLGRQADYDADPVAAAEAVAVNYGGHVSAGLYAARRLREQGHGTLVVLSSVAGIRVRRANFVYGSAKAGLDGFAQGLGDALHGSGARVMVVRPGFVVGRMTEGMTPAPLSSTPGQVADAVVAGLRSGAEIVWVPGALRLMFAVLRVLPRAVWRRMPR
ncbi:decaprenylphospho-beta-D-erythro-pentofuranosid-2-ulose 2-reductase [Planomonospora parontospora]|uniref:decaprenylphospho-beta-D-erythro-pentofuranosid- 2-ulose 2-reductase n=1 Tax=Planomonospora parontospora TaxID=58119 RepID=UPI00166F7CD4|nr:decaprenylphospho-beta-D-erythro-pentofuranosid-2-ulose 2-reductase [Planomonospora parontospora]GGL08336.1 short-chain dehydrogenase [Planomonospora parontospora subsp. antibiotica]GII14547.1 short-chain dehydrogenase [Planomonospora parontospora subsp. antibiotica]